MSDLFFISYSLKRGGAAIAASRLHRVATETVMSNESINSITQDKAGILQFTKRLISFSLNKLQFDGNPIKHSLNLFSYRPVLKAFEKHKKNVFNIHWVNNDTLSIFDFDKIPPGSVVTLHDEWLYCGSEHCYKINEQNLDFIHGYTFFKKGVWGIHWNYIIWKIKFKKLYCRPDLIYTVPSKWMLSRATQSLMLKNADVRLLPNAIDVDKFSPSSQVDVNAFRCSIGLSQDDIIFAYGAANGITNQLKGHYLLDEALRILSAEDEKLMQRVKFVNFGGKYKEEAKIHGFINISVSTISDASKLALLYSSVDCVVVSSLVESFGQIAAEALSCGTPVICYSCTGLTDIVIDGKTGLTAKPYSAFDLSEKLKEMILMDKSRRKHLGKNGREHVVREFSYRYISIIYANIINDAFELAAKYR